MSVIMPGAYDDTIPKSKTRPWPVYSKGKKSCVLLVGERWDSGYCAHYKKNGQHQIHCKFFKPDWRCIYEEDFFESDEKLFKI